MQTDRRNTDTPDRTLDRKTEHLVGKSHQHSTVYDIAGIAVLRTDTKGESTAVAANEQRTGG